MSEDMYRHPYPDEIDPFLPSLHEGALWQEKALDKCTRRARRLWPLVRRGVLTVKAYEAAMCEIRQRYSLPEGLVPRIIEPGLIYPVPLVPAVWQHLVPRTPAAGPAFFEFRPITGNRPEEE